MFTVNVKASFFVCRNQPNV